MAYARLSAALSSGACAGVLATRQRNAAKACTVSDGQVIHRMRLFAHRGASAQRPENTRAAFEFAFARGASGVECDLQRLRDGIVVLHDATLRRTARNCSDSILDSDVNTLTLSDVRDADIGSSFAPGYANERLLTCKSFLELVAAQGGECFVEVKRGDFGIVDELVECARASAVPPSNLTFIGFDVELMRRIKSAAPDYSCCGVGKVVPTGFTILDERRALEFARRCLDAGLDGADYNANSTVVTRNVVEYLHANNMRCIVWCSRAPAANDNPEIWNAMAAIGVDAFTSNCPEEAFEWWQAYNDTK